MQRDQRPTEVPLPAGLVGPKGKNRRAAGHGAGFLSLA